MKNASFFLAAVHRDLRARWRHSVWLGAGTTLLGLGLGAVFFYAGLQKHLAPFQFAEAVMGYRLLPQALVGVVAAVVPWVELITGFLLVVGYLGEVLGRMLTALGLDSGRFLLGGVKRRSCLLILTGLEAVFTLVMVVTVARGLKIDCGCGLLFNGRWGRRPSARIC